LDECFEAGQGIGGFLLVGVENKEMRGAVGVVVREFLVGECCGRKGDIFDSAGS